MNGCFTKNIKILGSAVSIGQPRSGVEHTPAVLKVEKIEKVIHPTNAGWTEIINQPSYKTERLRQAPVRNLREVADYNKKLYDAVLRHVSPSDFCFNIGGDHSIASSTISALLKVHKNNLAVLWIDAHGDCNTPITSPSGNYHGMALAHTLGLFKESEYFDWGQDILGLDSVAIIGVRDLDPEEKILMDKTGVLYYPMESINKLGIDAVVHQAMQKIDPNNTKMIHMSLDADGLDPSLLPGTGTAVPGGLSLEDYKKIAKRVRETNDRFVSMDLVEVNFEIEKEITLMNIKEILKTTFN
jgi:arginase